MLCCTVLRATDRTPSAGSPRYSEEEVHEAMRLLGRDPAAAAASSTQAKVALRTEGQEEQSKTWEEARHMGAAHWGKAHGSF